MSIDLVLARIAAIESALSAPSAAAATSLNGASAATQSATSAATSSAASTATPSSASSTTFADTLDSALSPEADATASILGDDDSDSQSGDAAGSSALTLDSLLANDPSLGAAPSTLGATGTTGTTSTVLQSLLASDPSLLSANPSLAAAVAGSAAAGTGSEGAGNQTIVAIARSQIGVTEEPPGSNDSPTIAEYRTATTGAMAGEPWCAYFASWVAQQAGEPLGAQGQGFGAVADIWSWAQQTGRAVTNGPGVVPAPGDLIVFGDHHVGIVDQVLPDGDIETVEGNYDNSVSQVIRSPTEATGYVRMS